MAGQNITDEDDVRAWVRAASSKARWVEPGLGSTPGLPDCWVPMEDGRSVHLELKAGRIDKGLLRFTVRPEQRKQILALLDDGVAVGLLIGVKGARSLIFMLPTPSALMGEVALHANGAEQTWLGFDVTGLTAFQDGVNFIFSDSLKMGRG